MPQVLHTWKGPWLVLKCVHELNRRWSLDDGAEFRETIGRPGVPPERFLLYDSQEDAAYVGRRMLLFAQRLGPGSACCQQILGSGWDI